jgi:CubicO group peptidase (beta-lactamase class C family)
MKRCLILRTVLSAGLVALILLGNSSGLAAAQPGRDFLPETREYLSRLEKLGFAGVVLIAVGGDPVLAEGYGLADRERRLPWNPATISTIGSITKQFTGAAILKLEEKGLLRVSDPITKYFEQVPADKSSITLHQLLTHSSGIEDLEDRSDWDPIGREEFIRLALKQPLAFSPGTCYSYSNAGYSLLGAIIEKVTGASYEKYLRQALFLPLGMYETGYILPAWGEGRLAQGYRASELWGTLLGRPMDTDGPYWVLRANGGIHSSCYDMLRWAQALLDGRVLQPESMTKYWTPHVSEGGDSFYGYGWSITTAPGDYKVITHNGGNGIFFADLALVPKAGLVIFLQTNVVADMPGAEELLGQIGHRVLADQPYPEVPKIIEIPESLLAPFEGTYQMNRDGDALRVAPDGKALIVEPEGQRAFSLLHSTQLLEPERQARLSGLMDKIMTACRAGDFSLLYKAYGGRVTIDHLKMRWREMVLQFEEKYGRLQGHKVLGTARTAERDETVVRFIYEKGKMERTYVWSLEAEPRLRGISMRGLKSQLRFLPVSEKEFASWDGGIRPSKSLRFDKDAAGHLELRIGLGDLLVEAKKN